MNYAITIEMPILRFPKGSGFRNLGGENQLGEVDFKVCGDELVLNILKLQMKKKILGGDFLSKLFLKGCNMKKEFGKPCFSCMFFAQILLAKVFDK